MEYGLMMEYQVSAELYSYICAMIEAAWHHDEDLDDLLPFTSAYARKAALLISQHIEAEVDHMIDQQEESQDRQLKETN